MTRPNIAALVTELQPRIKEIAVWLRNGDYDTRGGMIEMDRLASVAEQLLERLEAALQAKPAQDGPSPLTADDIGVNNFARAMSAKLAFKRAEGYYGWNDKTLCSAEHLSTLLRKHVEKGDPVDVANFAMMLHQRGERISPAPAGTALDDAGLRNDLEKHFYEIGCAALPDQLSYEMVRIAEDCADFAMRCVAASAENIQQNIDGQIADAFRDGYKAASLKSAPPAPSASVTDGWKLVPAVATEEMIEAGWIDKEDVTPDEIYSRMLDAAPAAPSHARGE